MLNNHNSIRSRRKTMSKHNLVRKAVRLALVCGVASGFVAGKTALAADQDQNANNQASTTQLGKIEVTGTRIKRTDVETAQPITVISAQQIKATGLTTVGEVVQKLTSAGAALNTLDNFGGNFTFTGGGQSNVDLRNLGAQRVLVLVNGKRWVTSLDNTVDLNTIPVSIIDHIEVLQDGASAIYGSDAISGVVNIVTVKSFDGREANAYSGIYSGDGYHDGKTQSYDFTFGSTNDHSGLVFNASYTNQEGIPSAHRNISKEPVFGGGPGSGSSATPQGRFIILPPSSNPGVNPNPAPGSNPPAASTGLTTTQCPDKNIGSNASPNYQPECNLTLTTGLSGTHVGDFRPFVGATDRFNYAPYNFVLTPEERFSTYLQGYTDLSDNVTFKADMMYSHRDSRQQAAPEPLFFASSSIALNIPATNEFNPFGFDLNASGATPNLGLLGRRMVENGQRLYHEKEDTFRLSGGFTGYANILGGEWDWDASYAFSKDTEIDINSGHFDVSHLRNALGPSFKASDNNFYCGNAANGSSPSLGIAGCVPLNLFGGAGSINQAMLAYSGYIAQNQFENNQRVYNADISNSSLFNLPAGPVGLAVGAQYLEHDGFFLPDSVAQNGYDSFNPGRPVAITTGRISEKSIYGEIDIPLVGNVPAFKLLDLDLATRHTKYNTFGTNNTSRAGLKWQPSDDMLVRATWSQGFRAPSINDLFSGPTNLSANVTDPCDTPAASPVCAAQGVPASYTQPNAQINTLEGGNPGLKPETSVSRTIGFVYSPDWLAGFNFNLDYYRINVESTIGPISGQVIFDGCYTATIAASNTAYCNRIQRSATFGTVTTLVDSVANFGTTFTDGLDLTLSYAFPSTAIGDFKASLDETHIKSYTLTFPNATGPATVTELAGVERGGTVFPFGIPHDKVRTALNWTGGAWSAEWDMRVVGHLQQTDGTHLGTTTYNDLQGSYNVDSIHTTFTLGGRNVFNKAPPVSVVQQLNSFDPTLYDVPGSFWYLRASIKF
jgi:iron complex outermembrane receptor protein